MFTLANAGAQETQSASTISHHVILRFLLIINLKRGYVGSLFYPCLARCLFFMRNAIHTVQKHLEVAYKQLTAND